MENKINFIIIGAQKAGTTTLYNWLKNHPEVYLPDKKEIDYFARDNNYKKGESYLNSYYKFLQEEKKLGMVYVHLMYFKHAAERIYKYNNNMKIICVLRNPVDRAYSAYWYAKRNGWEDANSFEEALKKEQKRLYSSIFDENAELTYVSHGYYAEQLLPYYKLFGKENIFVILSEELKSDRHNTMNKLMKFLNIDETINLDLTVESNKAAQPKYPQLQKILLSQNAWYKLIWRKLSSDNFRKKITNKIVAKIVSLNEIEIPYEQMPKKIKLNLQEHYYQYNLDLNKLLNKDTNWQ